MLQQQKARLEISFRDSQRPLALDILWTLHETFEESHRTFQSIDLVLRPISLLKYASYETLLPQNVTHIRQIFKDGDPLHPKEPLDPAIISNEVLCHFFLKALQHCPHGGSRAISLIFQNQNHSLPSAEFLEQRLLRASIVETVVTFVPLHPFVSRSDLTESQLTLSDILAKVAGGVLLHPCHESNYPSCFEQLDAELGSIFSLPSLLPERGVSHRISVPLKGQATLLVVRPENLRI